MLSNEAGDRVHRGAEMSSGQCNENAVSVQKFMDLQAELPDDDIHGGLKNKVFESLIMEETYDEKGVENVVAELDKHLRKLGFLGSINWIRNCEGISKKQDRMLDVLNTKLYSARNEAEAEFNFRIPSVMVDAKMITGAGGITPRTDWCYNEWHGSQ